MTGTVFHGRTFDPATKAVRSFGRESLAAELADRSTFLWIDLEAPDESALRELLAACGTDDRPALHFGAREILPCIEESPRYVSFHLFEVEDPMRHLDTSRGLSLLSVARLVVVLTKEWIVTFHTKPISAVREIRDACEHEFRVAGRTPGFVAFLLLQRCLYDYADLNLANDNYLDDLDPCVSGSARNELTADVGIAGRNILTLKKLTTSLHIVLMLLATKRSAFISDEGRSTFGQMQDNALAVRAAVDSSRDLLDGVVGAMQAESAQRTSEIATVLTVVSAIMLPLSLIAGMYGMNFEKIPGAGEEFGFWYLTAGMIAIAAVMIWVFRLLGWIGKR